MSNLILSREKIESERRFALRQADYHMEEANKLMIQHRHDWHPYYQARLETLLANVSEYMAKVIVYEKILKGTYDAEIPL